MTILVLGSNGLAGSAICRNLKLNNRNFIAATRNDVDLLNLRAVDNYFNKIKPSVIIGAAALVGGMAANIKYPVEFLINNLTIQNNTILSAYNNNVDKFVYLASSCVYPGKAVSPITEDLLLTGPLEKTNEAYAIAKISGLKLIQAFRDEYKRNWVSVMPTNLYGPGDNFDHINSHVLAALIRKFYEATLQNRNEIILWGTGNPRREFMHADDFASAITYIMDNYNEREPINIGTGSDVSIKELSEMLVGISGFNGEIKWDTEIPDGMYQKKLSVEKLNKLGWKSQITLVGGLKSTYNWFVQNYANTRLDVPVKVNDLRGAFLQ
jgi:GDP-L-fucose synthase